MANDVRIERRVDCTGLFCPMPIVKMREAMRAMRAGEVLELLSDDPASDADVRSWVRRTGNELLRVSRNGAVYHFFLCKA